MPITKHREKILEALRKWFHIHKISPTLEELCLELGMKPQRKATLQKWLQTMRGIDVEWDDNFPRSLRLLREDTDEPKKSISVEETLRYVARALVDWEKLNFDQRDQIPQSLHLAMSRMYLTSLLQGDNTAPTNLAEFFQWASNPVVQWKPATAIKNLSPYVTLIEDGQISSFTQQWAVSGNDVENQVQEKVLQDVLEYCRIPSHNLDQEYRAYRKLITTKPMMPFVEFRKLISTAEYRPLQDFLLETYITLAEFSEEKIYHRCPRCQYIKRRRPDGTYICRHSNCEKLAVQSKLPPLPTIPGVEADNWKIVKPGVHRYGTIPGLWEIYLDEELRKLGARVTLWPEIDRWDLRVEINKKNIWAIDVKDWSILDEDRLKKVDFCSQATSTFIVFPDERERDLSIRVKRDELELQLKGVQLRLISEILKAAENILKRKQDA